MTPKNLLTDQRAEAPMVYITVASEAMVEATAVHGNGPDVMACRQAPEVQRNGWSLPGGMFRMERQLGAVCLDATSARRQTTNTRRHRKIASSLLLSSVPE